MRRKSKKVKDKSISKIIDQLKKIHNEKQIFPWFHPHSNSSCLKCDAVGKLMVRIGVLTFCWGCGSDEFDFGENKRDKDKYSYWLDKQSDKWDEELK